MTAVLAEVERAWQLLDAGDIDGAEAAISATKRDHGDSADVVALEGAITAARGETARALQLLARAAELDPGFAQPLIQGAEIQLYSNDDPEACLELLEAAAELLRDEEEIADYLLLLAEAQLAAGRTDDAAGAIRELDAGSLDDPTLLIRAGQVLFGLGDDAMAEAAFRDAIARDPKLADAHHGLGGVLEQRDDRDGMIAAWIETRRLDLAAPRPSWRLSGDEFEEAAESALAELPPEVLARLENVPVLVDDVPSVEMVREGLDPRLLGLFSGVPLPHKSHITEQTPNIDAVHLFQRNLERFARTRQELIDEIRTTVLHETAHFFGLEDDDLEGLGLG